MDIRRLVGPSLLAAGVAFLGTGFLRGEATLSLILVIPVVEATGLWAFLGIVLIFAGFFATFLFWAPHVGPAVPEVVEPISPEVSPAVGTPAVSRRWGGVVFLGPVPIVFGSDQRVTGLMLVLGIVLFLALLALTLLALRP